MYDVLQFFCDKILSTNTFTIIASQSQKIPQAESIQKKTQSRVQSQ